MKTDRMEARINALGASLFFDDLTTAHAAAAGVDDVFALYACRVGTGGFIEGLGEGCSCAMPDRSTRQVRHRIVRM